MKKLASTKLLVIILSVFALLNVANQVYKSVYNPYKYETVITYTTKDAIPFKGLFVRQENIITYPDSQGVVTYNYDNGTKVSKDAPIISVFGNKEDAQRQLEIEALNLKIEDLKASQSADAISNSKLDTVNIALDNKSYQFISRLNENKYSDAFNIESELINFLNRMSLIKGKSENFNDLISSLTTRVNTLQAEMTSTPQYIRTEQSGYFISDCDGYEYLNFDNVSTLTSSDIDEIMLGGKAQLSPDSVGKILDNYYFKIAGVFNYSDVATLLPGSKVNLQIELNRTEINATIDSVNADENGKAVVIMTCDNVTDDFFQYRISDVQLVKASYTGIRVPRSSVRFNNNERGVYIKSGTVIEFKKIDVIYENNEFVICDTNSEKNELKVYDEIVTKGNNLYDNKSIG